MMKKLMLGLVIGLSLVGCSNEPVKVTVNGEEKVIPEKVYRILTKTDELPVKLAISKFEKGDIEIIHNGTVHKVFIRYGSAYVQLTKNGTFGLYCITNEELKQIIKAIK